MFVDKSFEKVHYITIQNAEWVQSISNFSSDVSIIHGFTRNFFHLKILAIPKGDYFYGNVSVAFNLCQLPTSLSSKNRGPENLLTLTLEERKCVGSAFGRGKIEYDHSIFSLPINGKAVENTVGEYGSRSWVKA